MEYKVGLVADLIGGQKDKPASGKLADLFTGKSTVNTPNKTQQQSKATKSAKAKSKSTSKKLKRSQPSGETASSEHGDAACTSSLGPSSQAPGFSPPPGIVHESLAASNPIQLPGGKRKKKSTEDDSDTETQNAQTKRPRRDRLKKASEKRTVFVGNVPLSCTIEEESVRTHFEDCGDVENVRIIRDRKTNLGKASASASAHPRKPAASADALKFKRPKFWQPTNSVTAGHRPKSMKNKKLKKAQLKKKHKKVDDVTRVLGPHKTATGSGKRMKTSQRGGQSTGLKNKRKGRPGGKK
ncbi:hypothetical protein BaRGS_00005924 [Batillaria attramentaria]|uniref:RRM domain-containing protein n=1 Tax=Batillaria attramentaria TaxID=370345 RepID=A0ABD0LUH6_9CAEN